MLKGDQKGDKSDQNGANKLARRPPKAPLGKRVEQISKKEVPSCIFGSICLQKICKNTIQRIMKNRSRTNIKIYARRVLKWSQNQCKNALKFHGKTGKDKYEEIHENQCFSDV